MVLKYVTPVTNSLCNREYLAKMTLDYNSSAGGDMRRKKAVYLGFPYEGFFLRYVVIEVCKYNALITINNVYANLSNFTLSSFCQVDLKSANHGRLIDSFGGISWCIAACPRSCTLVVGCEDGARLFDYSDGPLAYCRFHTIPSR